MSKLSNFKLSEKRKSRTRVGRGNGSRVHTLAVA